VQYSDTKLKKLKKNLKLIVFDLDGTIANTNNLILSCFAQLFGHNKKYYIKFMGPPSKKIIAKLFPKSSKKQINLYNHLWTNTFKNKLKTKSRIPKNTTNLLKKLNEKYLLGIITSASKKTAIITLKHNLRFFDFVICAEQQKEHKPNPETLNKIIKEYNLKPSSVIYVGDNVNDIVFGKNAKTKTIGKVDVLYNAKQLKKYKPDLIIKNLSELKCLL